jgi:hypothetical protein
VSFVKQDFSCFSFRYTQMVSEPKDSFFICLEVRELFLASSLRRTRCLNVQVLSLAYEVF